MSPPSLRRGVSLRVRIGVLLFAGVLMAGLGFYSLLLTLARQRLLTELDNRSRSFATLLAARLSTPLALRDRLEVTNEIRRASHEYGVAGVVVLDQHGRRFSEVVRDSTRWVRNAGEEARGEDLLRDEGRILERHRLREIETPILREVETRPGTLAELDAVLGVTPDPASASSPIGWVRLLYTTDPVDQAMAESARLGLTILLATLALWLIPLLGLLRVIARPLREASELARAIAAGEFERRIPVRSRDELGTLAESLNTMAAALTEAQTRVRQDAEAMRRATEAMMAIAQGARQAQDVDDVFEVVATQLRQVTASDGAALCLPDEEGIAGRFSRFSPPLPWGEPAGEPTLEPEVARTLEAEPSRALRIDETRRDVALPACLRSAGFRSALLVPLGDASTLGGVLLLASRDPRAYPPEQIEVVLGLAGHLGAALGASVLHARLQSAVAELEETRERLERSERMRMAGEMASGVAHDFNNVLGAILGRAQLLRRMAKREPLPGAELDRALEIIERAAQDGGDTVRRLRQFGAGPRDVRSEIVDLDEAIHDAAEFTRPRWEIEAQTQSRPIRVVFDLAPGAMVEGRGSEMRDIFTNLILNAIDALPHGGTIRLATRVDAERVNAVVEDDGVGIAPEIQRRIFDPFFTTKGESGTGLGLSVVYGILKAWGGDVRVQSAPGRGTRMELSFPRTLALVDPEPAPAPTGQEAPSMRVMVVDGEPAVRELLVDVLVSLGHECRDFESGAAALEAFGPGAFDLVFTDLGMPGMSGWDLARALRARDPDVPIAIITGWGAEVDPAALHEAGADALVGKPFTVEDVEGLLELARERREKRAA